MNNRHEKAILITGCSSGIGYSVAHSLKKRGYRVFATARKAKDVERLIEEGLSAYQLDLTDSASIKTALAQILHETGGKLFALFNNGAYGQPGAVEDLTPEVLRAQFETNFFGWHDLTYQVLPIMRKQNEGRIIQNSSVLGFAALPYRGAYNASKYAIEGLTDTLRLELKTTGIKVVLIEPGPIHSQFRENALTAWTKNIDPTHSYHRENYQGMIQRLAKKEATSSFTQTPDAVLKRVIYALEKTNPKPRYYVTFPTYLLGYLKRLLSSKLMDNFLLKASGDGKR